MTQDMQSARQCTHPSWEPAGNGKERCALCGVIGQERRYLAVDAAPPVQSDYKLVPIEPTEIMLDAGRTEMFVDVKRADGMKIVRRGYKAMLAAAPAAPQARDGERLDWLEAEVNAHGAIHLHDGSNPSGHGLGLRRRTLREAIDTARQADAALAQENGEQS